MSRTVGYFGRAARNKLVGATVVEEWSNFTPKWARLAVLFSGSSKMAPRILIFSIAMVADYSFELNFIET